MTRRASSKAISPITLCRLTAVRGVAAADLRRAVRLSTEDREVRSLSIVLGSDELLARLHGEFMGDPTPTDVLTFDLRDEGRFEKHVIEGEVVVSVDTAMRESRRRGLSLRDEVLRYVIHGTLHLVGYDDKTPAMRRKMRREEDRILASLCDMISSSRWERNTRGSSKRG